MMIPVKRATQNAIEERRNPTHYAARSAQQYRDLLTNAGLTVVDEKTVTFERELDEWLAELPLDSANGAIVREMMEAGIETDAAGLHTRRHGETIIFEQRLYYCKAVKETRIRAGDLSDRPTLIGLHSSGGERSTDRTSPARPIPYFPFL